MTTLRFARGWWLIALIAAGVLAAASPAATAEDIFVGGFFSLSEKNIDDEHYTLPQTLVMR